MTKAVLTSLLCLVFITKGTCQGSLIQKVTKTLSKQVLLDANRAVQEEPVTVTSASCERSKGGKHDFFSEGDYFVFNGQSDSAYLYRQNQLIYKWKPLLGTFDFFGSKGQLREKHKL